jgi:prepilin-type processing-associated H-X9-DG protein
LVNQNHPSHQWDYCDSPVKHFVTIGYVTEDEMINCPARRDFRKIPVSGTLSRVNYFVVGYGTDRHNHKYNKHASEADLQPFMADILYMPVDSPYPLSDSGGKSSHEKGDPRGANIVYIDGHAQWSSALRQMWWGPFKGYITTVRKLIPPRSTACYSGSASNQPGPW